MSSNILTPEEVREGMQLLHQLAAERNRQDVATTCTAILFMDDNELAARQHEIAALRHMGVSAIACGYLEASIAKSE